MDRAAESRVELSARMVWEGSQRLGSADTVEMEAFKGKAGVVVVVEESGGTRALGRGGGVFLHRDEMHRSPEEAEMVSTEARTPT